MDYDVDPKFVTAIGVFALALVVLGAFWLWATPSHPVPPDPSQLVEVECLRIDGGPVLHFSHGGVMDGNTPVGTYSFSPAVGGKHGPMIEVDHTRVFAEADKVRVVSGTEGWFWEFVDRDTVRIVYPPQNVTIGHRC